MTHSLFTSHYVAEAFYGCNFQSGACVHFGDIILVGNSWCCERGGALLQVQRYIVLPYVTLHACVILG